MGGRSINKINLKPYFLCMPFLLIMIFTFFIGSISGVLKSFGIGSAFGDDGFTFKYYTDIISDPTFIISVKNTFYITIVSSVLSTVIGIYLALYTYQSITYSKIKANLVNIPIYTPYLVYVLIVIFFLMPRGLINSIFKIDDFPLLINDKYSIGVILVYLLKQIPFILVTVMASLSNLDKNITKVAYNLGATKFKTSIFILMPLVKLSMISSFLITFAFTFGSFEVPYILGNPKYKTLPVLAYEYYTDSNVANRPYAISISIIMAIISLICVLLFYAIIKKISKTKGDV